MSSRRARAMSSQVRALEPIVPAKPHGKMILERNVSAQVDPHLGLGIQANLHNSNSALSDFPSKKTLLPLVGRSASSSPAREPRIPSVLRLQNEHTARSLSPVRHSAQSPHANRSSLPMMSPLPVTSSSKNNLAPIHHSMPTPTLEGSGDFFSIQAYSKHQTVLQETSSVSPSAPPMPYHRPRLSRLSVQSTISREEWRSQRKRDLAPSPPPLPPEEQSQATEALSPVALGDQEPSPDQTDEVQPGEVTARRSESGWDSRTEEEEGDASEEEDSEQDESEEEGSGVNGPAARASRFDLHAASRRLLRNAEAKPSFIFAPATSDRPGSSAISEEIEHTDRSETEDIQGKNFLLSVMGYNYANAGNERESVISNNREDTAEDKGLIQQTSSVASPDSQSEGQSKIAADSVLDENVIFWDPEVFSPSKFLLEEDKLPEDAFAELEQLASEQYDPDQDWKRRMINQQSKLKLDHVTRRRLIIQANEDVIGPEEENFSGERTVEYQEKEARLLRRNDHANSVSKMQKMVKKQMAAFKLVGMDVTSTPSSQQSEELVLQKKKVVALVPTATTQQAASRTAAMVVARNREISGDPDVAKFLREAVISNPKIQSAVQELTGAVQVIAELNLDSYKLTLEDVTVLGKALKYNSSLVTLSLFSNQIDYIGAEFIAQGIQIHPALTSLNLHNNCIGAEGAKAIGEALLSNMSLTDLNLNGNGIGDEGAESLEEALKFNCCLVSIDLQCNRISDARCLSIMRIWALNTHIITIRLSGNMMTQISQKAAQNLQQSKLGTVNGNTTPGSSRKNLMKSFKTVKNFSTRGASNLGNPALHSNSTSMKLKRLSATSQGSDAGGNDSSHVSVHTSGADGHVIKMDLDDDLVCESPRSPSPSKLGLSKDRKLCKIRSRSRFWKQAQDVKHVREEGMAEAGKYLSNVKMVTRERGSHEHLPEVVYPPRKQSLQHSNPLVPVAPLRLSEASTSSELGPNTRSTSNPRSSFSLEVNIAHYVPAKLDPAVGGVDPQSRHSSGQSLGVIGRSLSGRLLSGDRRPNDSPGAGVRRASNSHMHSRSMKPSSLRAASDLESSTNRKEALPIPRHLSQPTVQENLGLQRVGLIEPGTHPFPVARQISGSSNWQYDNERVVRELHSKHAHASLDRDDSTTPFKTPELARSMLSSVSVVHPVVALEAKGKEKKHRPSSLQGDTAEDEIGSL